MRKPKLESEESCHECAGYSPGHTINYCSKGAGSWGPHFNCPEVVLKISKKCITNIDNLIELLTEEQ